MGPHADLLRTATHEAGHVVAAFALGFGVAGAHVLREGDLHGETRFTERLVGARGLVVLQAGDAALELLEEGLPAPTLPTALPWLWKSRAAMHARDQAGESVTAAEYPTDDERSARAVTTLEVEAARVLARDVLRQRWPAVRDVAEELLLEGIVAAPMLRRRFDRTS